MSDFAFRVWAGIVERKRCRYCRKPIVLRRTDRNKRLALQPSAEPLRQEKDDAGRAFDIFAPDASHRRFCKKPKTRKTGGAAAPAAKRSTTSKPQQGTLL